MGEQNNLNERIRRWAEWAKIITAVVAGVTLLLGGGFFYNEVWNAADLRYTFLPEYDLDNQVFSGIVLENRGRVPLTNVRIDMADIGSEIEKVNMPGAHEPVEIVSGGEGHSELHVLMPRLSSGASLPVYMLTQGPLVLGENTLLITSDEVGAKPSTTLGEYDVFIVGLLLLNLVAFAATLVFGEKQRRRKERATEELQAFLTMHLVDRRD